MTDHNSYTGQLAAWDQMHARGLTWLRTMTNQMWHPVRHLGPALAVNMLYNDLCRTDIEIDGYRKAISLAIVELARRDLVERGVNL